MKKKRNQSGIFVEKKIVVPIPKPGNQNQQRSKKKHIEGQQDMQERFHSGSSLPRLPEKGQPLGHIAIIDVRGVNLRKTVESRLRVARQFLGHA